MKQVIISLDAAYTVEVHASAIPSSHIATPLLLFTNDVAYCRRHHYTILIFRWGKTARSYRAFPECNANVVICLSLL